MDDKLTEQDFEILIDALDDWVESGNNRLIINSVIGSAIVRDDSVARSDFEKRMRSDQDKFEQVKRSKIRQATLLKAKLILMQQRLMNSPSEFSVSEKE